MTINWKEYIENNVAAGRLAFPVRSTVYGKEYIRILTAKYLMEQGMTEAEVKKWFANADPDFYLYAEDMNTIIETSKRRPWPKEFQRFVVITPEEIDKIESLDISLENKRFLLGIVCMCKLTMAKKGVATLNKHEKADVWRWAHNNNDNVKSNESQKMRKALKWFIDNHILEEKSVISSFKIWSNPHYTNKRTNIVLCCDWINYEVDIDGITIRDSGKNSDGCIDFGSGIEKIVEKYFTEKAKICPICGMSFDINSKTKRVICEECLRKKQLEYFQAYNQRRVEKLNTNKIIV